MSTILEFSNVMIAVAGTKVDVRFETTTHADALKLAEILVAQLREQGVPMEKHETSANKKGLH